MLECDTAALPGSDTGATLSDQSQRLNHLVALLAAVCQPASSIRERVQYIARLANQLDTCFAAQEPISADLAVQLERCWHSEVAPLLSQVGLRIVAYETLTSRQQLQLRRLFTRHIFRLLTPLAIDATHPFPYISHLSLNLAVVLRDSRDYERYARVKVPRFLPRLLPITWNGDLSHDAEPHDAATPDTPHVWIEEVVAANLDQLFPALPVVVSAPFRVIRKAQEVASSIGPGRGEGPVVRLDLTHVCPGSLRALLTQHLGVASDQVHVGHGPLGLADLLELPRLQGWCRNVTRGSAPTGEVNLAARAGVVRQII